MFTGIVEQSVEVAEVAGVPGGRRLVLAHRWGDERRGESVAVNGCCLTVSAIHADSLAFDVVRETLDKTNLGRLAAGDRAHVERSLRAGDRIDGHFVQGHVDGVAELVDRVDSPEQTRLRVRPPGELMRFVLPKGSVAIDGVSLTIAALHGETFEVALIPTTLDATLLGGRRPGWGFNFEADVMAKGIVAAVERSLAEGRGEEGGGKRAGTGGACRGSRRSA